jgi:hypothetical protein
MVGIDSSTRRHRKSGTYADVARGGPITGYPASHTTTIINLAVALRWTRLVKVSSVFPPAAHSGYGQRSQVADEDMLEYASSPRRVFRSVILV